MMKPSFSGSTDPGLLRASNQDDYYLDPEGRFFIVADGMGGHAGGQEASRLATETVSRHLNRLWDETISTADLLHQALLAANRAILRDQLQYPERADMGTTAVILTCRDHDDHPWCAHVGDSRLYRLHQAQLIQVTEDHTWIARAIREGELTPAQSRYHPWRHVLSQCLGREDLHHIKVQPVTVAPGDRFLLCSDGLTEELQDATIAEHLTTAKDCQTAVEGLIEAAKHQGGRDNITAVVVAFQGDSDPVDPETQPDPASNNT